MQSVWIFLKFFHPCLLWYLLCLYTIFKPFERVFLCLAHFGSGWHCLNFDKFRDLLVVLLNDLPSISSTQFILSKINSLLGFYVISLSNIIIISVKFFFCKLIKLVLKSFYHFVYCWKEASGFQFPWLLWQALKLV